jgi:CheY-like chemotaxis protein
MGNSEQNNYPGQARQADEPKTILVVDDEQVLLEMLEDLLTDAGYRVCTARNGREALAHLTHTPADLVLTDVMMPLMDGPALYHAMRANPAYAAIPVLLMSMAGSAALPAELMEHDHDHAFILKPFKLEGLLGAISRLLSS